VKIGIDSHAAERDGTGNASYISGLVHALVSLAGDDEYILYAIDPHHRFYAALEPRAKVTVRRLWPRHPAVRIPLALAAASYRDRLDVLHVQYVGPPWHRGARIVTVHDLAFLHVPKSYSTSQRLRLRWLVPRNVRRAAAVITGSEFSKRDIQRTYGIHADRISVIHDAPDRGFRPVADETMLAALRKRLSIRRPYVLYVGRLNPRKNVLGLLHAFERVRPQLREPTQLVIAGPPDFHSRHLDAAIAASSWRRDVIRAGYVDGVDLPALYSGASAFVYPSLSEGFGLPPLEAMACGTPVVCSSAASLEEVVGQAALLVRPGRVDDLAEAIARVLTDPVLRATLSRRGLERAARFSWTTAAQQTLDLYRRASSDAP
jgi:glycosyltransferase involved in cell wall biosynthesis